AGAPAAGAALLQPAGLGPASGLAAAAGLLVHGAVSPGDGLQAAVGDRVAADHRLAVGALLDPTLRALDRIEGPAQFLADRLVALRLVQLDASVARVDGLVGSPGGADRLELALDARALLGETVPCTVQIHAGILSAAPRAPGRRLYRPFGIQTAGV